jgi:hypothetical protein
VRPMITWQERIEDLEGVGMTREEIAKSCGMALSTLGDIATGRTKEPRGDAAVAMHQLHVERCLPRKPNGVPAVRKAS